MCQDEFADPIWDPKGKYLSTNRAYWNAINEGYDYVIGLQIEFFAENSDTLMHHAMKNYQNFVQGKTHIIYNDVPVEKYQKYLLGLLISFTGGFKGRNHF